MYGGRVTDDYDRRVLMCYLNEYLGTFIFDKNQRFIFAVTQATDYVVPNEENLELTLEFIAGLPLFTPPSVYGLHANAEIVYFTNAAKELWVNILEMATSEGGDASGFSRDDFILQIANDIQDKTLPELFDEYNIRKAFDVPSPT